MNVKNLQRLWAIPEAAKQLIRDGVVSATLIMGYLKNKNTNIEELVAELQKQAKSDDSEKGAKKKKAKITAKNAPAKKGKTNGLAEFKRFRKQENGVFKNNERKAAFEMLCQIVDNKASYVDILEYFTGK